MSPGILRACLGSLGNPVEADRPACECERLAAVGSDGYGRRFLFGDNVCHKAQRLDMLARLAFAEGIGHARASKMTVVIAPLDFVFDVRLVLAFSECDVGPPSTAYATPQQHLSPCVVRLRSGLLACSHRRTH